MSNSGIEDYLSWLARTAPAVAAQLRGPAAEADLDALEAHIGFELPPDVRTLYRRHDGQAEDHLGIGAVYGLVWLPVAKIIKRWDSWHEVRSAPNYDPAQYDPYEDVFVPGVVKQAYTRPGWVPLFNFGTTADCFGVDLDPDPDGHNGQVINFGRDETKKYAAANNVDEFLGLLAHWGAAETAGAEAGAAADHVEDLFAPGALLFNRFYGRASGKPTTLTTAPARRELIRTEESVAVPAGLAEPVDALVAAVIATLRRMQRLNRLARVVAERTQSDDYGSLLIAQPDFAKPPEDRFSWDHAHWDTPSVDAALEDVLVAATELGLTAAVDIRLQRVDDDWIHQLVSVGTPLPEEDDD